MKSYFVIAIGILFGLSILRATGQERIGVRSNPDLATNVTRETVASIKLALKSRHATDFAGQTLDDVIRSMSEKLQIPIMFDERALADEGISKEMEVTLKLQAVSFQNILRQLLEPRGLTYVIEDGVLKITTVTNAAAKLLVRVYPIRDLVATEGDQTREYLALLGVIQQTIRGEHVKWEQLDGEGGSISPVPNAGSLVIRQTQRCHEEIDGLFTALRRAKQLRRVPWIGANPEDVEDSELTISESRRIPMRLR